MSSTPDLPVIAGSTKASRLPIGVSDFATLVQGEYLFVDKTPLIEELIQGGAQVTLLSRPRRFGKTLNLSMLQRFFAKEVDGRPTAPLFAGLAIARRPDAMAHQGRYPVIFFSFKDIRAANFEAFKALFRETLAALYRQHPQLSKSRKLDMQSRQRVRQLLAGEADEAAMATSFRLLSELLFKHHGREVVILLDEYDTPLHSAFLNGFYRELIEFMRKLLGGALKDNPYLHRAVVTGILKIAKENLFSGLNNPKVLTVLDDTYARYFGFTEAEVAGFLESTGLGARQPGIEAQIKDWYNGYRFGRETIYNPWSIISCLDNGGALRPYWVNTGGDDILKNSMARASASFKQGLEELILGRTVQAVVDPNLVLAELDGNAVVLWSLLLFSGYLTAEETRYDSEGFLHCRLRIPNREIEGLYRRYIKDWFNESMTLDGYRSFLASLTSGDVAEFEKRLREYTLRSMSFFDSQGDEPEKFYHGLVLGMMVGLDETHVIRSNRESGYGRYDMTLSPKHGSDQPGIVLEFKRTAEAGELEGAAREALAQIEKRRYETELRNGAVEKIVKIGIAFNGKDVAVAWRAASSSLTGTHD